ncbi:hypothetical protein [Parachlamydia sp. AcF125]|uniref:hypothetical protein n=1 Tax=Parachlamydia sp. AcF125 TaxID=2795736 RepID=UPI001BC8E319|nr:hypothetical protein [Parachlamydia sp. AcF125]MBS4167483.1 2-succinyl-6-hydroxy-2, 4-cyclohexadiene-1-carboxylate synthase [Parachlamydia sp. AcF125]
MINPLIIHGVKFFDNASSCISQFEKLHWTQRAISFIQSFGTLFAYGLNKISRRLRRVEIQMAPYTTSANLSKKKLVVCLHGLNENPAQFKKIIDELEKRSLAETDVYIPRILQKGNGKLDEMVQPIFENIKKWAKANGEKELILVGISNGARIARAIEAELTKPGNRENLRKIRFVSIVGACKGSSLARLAHRFRLSWMMSKNISEEMPINSRRNARLDKEWEEGLKNSSELTRDYIFIASPHDWQVPNYCSTLMKIPHYQARYAIIKGHGHISIVNAAAKVVADMINLS